MVSVGPSVMVGLTTVGTLVGGAGCVALPHEVAACSLVGGAGSQDGWLHGPGSPGTGTSPLVGR